MDVSTQIVTQLTTGNHRDLYPDWSPDGSEIVFASNRDGNFELYVMRADGTAARRLTNTPEDEVTPSWSPDGEKIAYVQVRTIEAGLQEKRLYILSETGGGTERLTDGLLDEDPNWSPDGRYLLFERTEEIEDEDGSTYRIRGPHLLSLQEGQIFSLMPVTREVGHGAFDSAQWLPREGHFLSMVQAPGDVASSDIKVFELLWDNGVPTLHRVFGVADADRYTWGSNGEWLIAVVSRSSDPGTTLPPEAFNEFYLLPVDFSSQSLPQFAVPTAIFSYPSLLGKGEYITDDTFYDDYPDWSP